MACQMGGFCVFSNGSSAAEYPFRHALLIGFVCLRHDRHSRRSHLGRRGECDRIRAGSVCCLCLPDVSTVRAKQCRRVSVIFHGREE